MSIGNLTTARIQPIHQTEFKAHQLPLDRKVPQDRVATKPLLEPPTLAKSDHMSVEPEELEVQPQRTSSTSSKGIIIGILQRRENRINVKSY